MISAELLHNCGTKGCVFQAEGGRARGTGRGRAGRAEGPGATEMTAAASAESTGTGLEPTLAAPTALPAGEAVPASMCKRLSEGCDLTSPT